MTRAPASNTDIQDEVIALCADLAGALGFPRSYGQIYGLIYASARPLSFTDIQAKLKLSKGSVSQGLRTLRDAGAIRRVEGLDWRREHFAPETELRQLLAGFVARSVLPRVEGGTKRLAALKARVGAKAGARDEEHRVLTARIEKLTQWHRKAVEILPVAVRFLE